ncbi:hypothetical protein D3C72_805460 [compost metagenome]
MAGQVLGKAVGDRHGATGQQQFHGHRAANDIGRADNHGIHPVKVDTGAFQQGHDAFGGAWAQQRDTLGQATDVIRMETVDVFIRTNALQQPGGVQVFGKRKLKQNAVDCRVVVQAIDQLGQRFLSGFGRQVIGLG